MRVAQADVIAPTACRAFDLGFGFGLAFGHGFGLGKSVWGLVLTFERLSAAD